MKLSAPVLIFLFLLIDLFLLSLSQAIVAKLQYNEWLGLNDLFFLLNGLWIITYIFYLDIAFIEIQKISKRLKILLKKFFVYISLGSIFIVLLNMDDISRTMFLNSSLCFVVLKLPVTYIDTYLASVWHGVPTYKKVLIIGAGRVGAAIQTFYKCNPERGKLIGFLDDKISKSENFNVLGPIKDFQKVFDALLFNHVIITIDPVQDQTIKDLVNLAEYNGVRPSVVVDYYSLFNRNFELDNLIGLPIVTVRKVPLDFYIPRFCKRIFDLLFSSFVLLITSPIFLVIAIAIKLDSRGPIFYRSIRGGKNGTPILIYKFRSMKDSSHQSDNTPLTTLNDDRITHVGKFIRKYNLDELPQFVNVFNGDMSVVGPRPHRLDLDKQFQQIAPNYMVRQYIKPGITGWAQVNGLRGPTETKYQYVARTLHDLWYVEHWNFALDLYVIFLTIFGKKARENAF